ncbi:SDR family oxidoreductase [Nigerium sp.]|jgi:NAD(P)-dependent dehydrogenase (short-subunit alcohol dehydrogenase family)|uniref:SDR family oxidoreductase n=1 Tax=Nigerium sp. TaxID=2042655 RepID=UPI003221E155
MSNLNEIDRDAAALASDEGGFPEQEQLPPGLTTKMDPIPDHGETTWVGHGRLQGLKALITGGDSGIGRAVAIAFAREGASVALGYLPEEQSDAEDTRGWVEEAGVQCVLLPGDLTDEETARTTVDMAADRLGGLDIVVNNAGFQWARREGGLTGLKTDEMDRVFKTNLYALFWVSQQALKHLGKGASIINVSSIQAYDPSESLVDYAATKAAINNFTVNLAAEVGDRGIRVNAIAPGPIWTPLQPATKGGDSMPGFGGDTPLGRAGQPSELAGAFVFLASPAEASYVSGTVIGVTGGKPVF